MGESVWRSRSLVLQGKDTGARWSLASQGLGSGPVWLDGMNTESRGLRKGVSGTSGKVSVSRRGSSREVNTDFYSREMVLASVERQTHTEVKGLRYHV